MENYAIEVRNVSKVYKLYHKPFDRVKEALGVSGRKQYVEHHALSDININIRQGECVGIIGTNGAGKSTLLKIITGVLSPSQGEVRVNGRISALLELGAGFNGEYSGIDNIYLNGRMNGFTRSEVDARLEDILAFADIGDFVHQPVKTYSSGMFVRLAFAVAINIEPEILIIDEALSVGDIFFQAKCFRKIEEFKNSGKTILFVSHSMGSIQKYCDRAVLLNKGRQIIDTTPKAAIDLFNKMTVMEEKGGEPEKSTDGRTEPGTAGESECWKQRMNVNPKAVEYGNEEALIVDYCLYNEKGEITNTIHKGEEFTVKMKVHFNKDIQEPIFAFTVKDIKGTELTGSNTLLGDKMLAAAHAGDDVVITFRQKMSLRCNDYLLALGCTGYKDGKFTVYHRLYDVCYIMVLSEKDTVGLFDLYSDIKVTVS